MVFDDRVDEKYYYIGDNFLGGLLKKQTIQVMDQVRGFWDGQTNLEMIGWQVMVTDTPDKVIPEK